MKSRDKVNKLHDFHIHKMAKSKTYIDLNILKMAKSTNYMTSEIHNTEK